MGVFNKEFLILISIFVILNLLRLRPVPFLEAKQNYIYSLQHLGNLILICNLTSLIFNKPQFYIIRGLLFTLLWWSSTLIIVFFQIPGWGLLTVNRNLGRFWMRKSQILFSSFLILITYLLAPVKLILTGKHNELGKDTFAPIIANHQIYTDWWYIFLLAYLRSAGDSLKIMLMSSLSKIPLAGWGMRGFEFIFLARKWTLDRQTIISSLDRALKDPQNMWCLLFPEGTVLCHETMQKSVAYAKKNQLEFDQTGQTLLPKCTGLFHVLRALQPRALYLYDFTVGYSDHEKDIYAYDVFSPIQVFVGGLGPKEIHIHVSRYKIDQIPGISKHAYDPDEVTSAEFEKWVYAIFKEKSKRLDGFYKDGSFGTDNKIVMSVGPEAEAEKRNGWVGGAICVAAVIAAYLY